MKKEGRDSPKVRKQKAKARKISIAEGSAANLAGGVGHSYITPFALALEASNLQIGLLSSFPGLLSPLAQVYGSKLMEKASRKTLVMRFVLLQSLMWLPIAFLGYLFWKGIFQQYLPIALIILYTLVVIFGGLAHPSWFSWMGDITKQKHRGSYFAKRNKATGSVGLIAAIAAGFLLDLFRTKGLVFLGFIILFTLAFTFRFISQNLFRKQYHPEFKLKKGYYFTFWQFLKRYDNYGKFAVYRALSNFALFIAAPFFAVYMLEDLGFSYTTFIIVSASGSVFYLLFTPLAGKFSDRFGNLKLLYLSSFLFALTPILWILLEKPLHLIVIPQLIAGLANAAMIISITNFVYDSVSPQRRGICSAYKNILAGIGVFAGAIVGGFIANNFILSSVNPLFLVFGISAIARFLVPLFFLPQIREEKKVKSLPPMHIDLTHPFKTLHAEADWFKYVFR